MRASIFTLTIGALHLFASACGTDEGNTGPQGSGNSSNGTGSTGAGGTDSGGGMGAGDPGESGGSGTGSSGGDASGGKTSGGASSGGSTTGGAGGAGGAINPGTGGSAEPEWPEWVTGCANLRLATGCGRPPGEGEYAFLFCLYASEEERDELAMDLLGRECSELQSPEEVASAQALCPGTERCQPCSEQLSTSYICNL